MALGKFGHVVRLTVTNEAGVEVFKTSALRVDFDIRMIRGFDRAKITIINMAPESSKAITSGKNNFATLEVSEHGSEFKTLARDMFISNGLEESKLPESHTSIFCYSKIKKLVLDTVIAVRITPATLRNVIEGCVEEAGIEGRARFLNFPIALLDEKPPSPRTQKGGRLGKILDQLGAQHKFNYYTDGKDINFLYKPDHKNVGLTDLKDGANEIVLNTVNMISNPKIGAASLNIVSSLEPEIKPTSILDISNLVTVGTSISTDSLEISKQVLQDKVAGYVKYQALQVQHKGSNFTKEWLTAAMAVSPTPGTSMKTDQWWT